ncbi:molybdenum ABC transporter ATP-binding protein [Vibrio hannami]|uniref:molybdenum ABC transporter ATP-binding protein n=1 Tax=Vibrio hannami TaxID=2717094 RepID=UPI00240F7A7F|nr:molybdenum ABC transporter ATP-binding protein [Vibrio hannami]MDG3085023.1 molybdenum ABC transporter ATP-binding protein [Vibrio hannami]
MSDMNQEVNIVARFNIEFENFSLKADLTLPSTGVTVLFGHSGSGKTTCLRAMAGLEKLSSGYFSVGETTWQDSANDFFVPTYQRDIGYVFQEAGLFPHLSVRKNLEYGFKRVAEERRVLKLRDVCELLGITHLLERSPEKLSGGEMQRVAIARALLTSPKMLLMDEPLAALDSARKAEILPYLEKLHKKLSIPIIYVTHSVEELARLADHIVLFYQGNILTSGGAVEVMSDPAYSRIFNHETGAIFDTIISDVSPDHLTQLEVGRRLYFYVPEIQGQIGDYVRCRILASDVSICLTKPAQTSILNVVKGKLCKIEDSVHGGEKILVITLSNGQSLLSVITERSLSQLGIQIGMELWCQIKAVAIC